MSQYAVEVENVSKEYMLGRELQNRDLQSSVGNLLRLATRRTRQEARQPFQALSDVSLTVNEGEIVGVVGHNGSGKSTLLKIISRITAPTRGRVVLRGRVGSLLEVGTGFHPEMTGRENIYVNGSILGMTQSDIDKQFDEIIAFADIGNFLDTPVKRYSSGMYVRLAFAVAAHLQPEILLVDEVLAVGDANFQKKCLGKMADIGAGGRTILFVSHNLQAITRLCSRVFLLDHGHLIAAGDPHTVIRQYLGVGSGGVAERIYPVSDRTSSEAVRLNAIRACDVDGNTCGDFEIQQTVCFEYDFDVLQDERQISPSLMLYNVEGTILFRHHGAGETNMQPLRRGRYISRVEIPPNLLNEGPITLEAALLSHQPSYTRHVHIVDALAVTIVDRHLSGGARGGYAGTINGAVRPALTWVTQPVTQPLLVEKV